MEPDVTTAMLRRVEELQQLADSIAEHHPYWPALHFTLQLLGRLVDKWRENLTNRDKEELLWLAEKIRESIEKIQTH
ncbi:conserved hypothetical protein [Pyrobaculum islandicum DSM 4184]|uniref:Uncharacterized protein n=1 Tax=Pyrobaculum islandicum (strain DSM 4184 / JCM 9189 / GEO3) TaxID=384616 RepID=A1RU48_PYRIL|nr:hypothetical protein [Pyrobaculum islandicum]ABL88480.1 conserved hypothetical protein [Pyrobaculum islandicum DSM 4184]